MLEVFHTKIKYYQLMIACFNDKLAKTKGDTVLEQVNKLWVLTIFQAEEKVELLRRCSACPRWYCQNNINQIQFGKISS